MENKHTKTGFDTPQGYFDSFEDRLMLRMMEEQLPKSTGFSVPADYFKNLEENLIAKTSRGTSGRVVHLNSRKTMLYIAASAACFVLILSLFQSIGDANVTNLDDVPYTSIEQYIDDGNLDLDTYDVLAILNDQEISDLTRTAEMFSEETLENYLIDTLDETSLLIDQQ